MRQLLENYNLSVSGVIYEHLSSNQDVYFGLYTLWVMPFISFLL